MIKIGAIKRTCRDYEKDGRKFTITYELQEREEPRGPAHLIRVSLVEKEGPEEQIVTGCNVELFYLRPEIGLKLNDIISGAKEPVFPVHVADIVRDKMIDDGVQTKAYF